jgi:hypothetical protein
VAGGEVGVWMSGGVWKSGRRLQGGLLMMMPVKSHHAKLMHHNIEEKGVLESTSSKEALDFITSVSSLQQLSTITHPT